MKLTCPVCRAENTAGPNCRRCRADLALLVDLETNRSRHIALARYAIWSRRGEDALDELDQAEQLRAGDDIARLRACALLIDGDFSGALREYAAGRSAE